MSIRIYPESIRLIIDVLLLNFVVPICHVGLPTGILGINIYEKQFARPASYPVRLR
jgi:hypothetical protein